MELLRYINYKLNSKLFLLPIFITSLLFLTYLKPSYAQEQVLKIWEVRSIDTMKTSRDRALSELNNSNYDIQIQKELSAIKEMGANYVAVDTPYDEEFLPYLNRWVMLARKTGLHIWFRGNWSNWEGWFDYPKNMRPQEHIRKTAEFIETHPDLFMDGDAFDPCPECENAGFWKQPEDDEKYRQFIRNQRITVKNAFAKIGKDVHTNWFSIIGGRAKDVLDQKTFDALDNLITIDHYIKNPSGMSEYVDYFSQNFNTKVLVGEFGVPIPDINGDMDETEQAEFINQVFKQLYKNKDSVLGINYWVAVGGTTRLINDDGTPRQAVDVIKNYFIPGMVRGAVINTLGKQLNKISVKTDDGLNETTTDNQGNYVLIIPAGSVNILVGGDKYKTSTQKLVITRGNEVIQDTVLEPKTPPIFYRLHLFLKKKFNL